MFKIFFTLVTILLLQAFILLAQANPGTNKSETITTPIIDIIPKEILIENDTTNFAVETVIVLNRGVGILHINSISASCYCSNGVIEKNDILFLDTGKLRLEINKEGLENDDDTVLFTVVSNAKNSPYFLKVKFVEKK